jgi:hypothetical protein
VAAGEDVRWLPRRQATQIALPGNDFWLFDDDTLLINHFSGEGRSTGHELNHDPDLITLCSSAFSAVWDCAVPHEHFRPT